MKINGEQLMVDRVGEALSVLRLTRMHPALRLAAMKGVALAAIEGCETPDEIHRITDVVRNYGLCSPLTSA